MERAFEKFANLSALVKMPTEASNLVNTLNIEDVREDFNGDYEVLDKPTSCISHFTSQANKKNCNDDALVRLLIVQFQTQSRV